MALDNQNERQNIIGKINSIIATLDFDIQLKKERQNADAWKKLFRDLGQTVGNITDNPIPFLLGLIKLLKAKSNKNPKSERAQQRAFRRAEKKKRRKEDNNSPDGSSKTWMAEKHPKLDGHLKNVVGEEYGRILRDIIIKCVKRVVPKIPDMLVEEILRAFNCDLNMEVPVVGDGLTTDIVVRVDQIDLFKQLVQTPDEGVGKFLL